jgi:hypothetical protein
MLLAGALVLVGCSGDDDTTSSATTSPEATSTTSDASTTTEAPLTGDALVVAEQGLSTFPDPIDPLATLGGYGVVLQNPNDDVMATGVQVVTRILDAAGAELLVDRAVLNGVMPGARMAVGRTLIEPIVEPTTLDVQVEVTAWLRPASTTGTLTASEVLTEADTTGAMTTTFTVTSTWPTTEDGVDVTAVYRAEDGRILGADSTLLDGVTPGVGHTARIALLSPIPDLASTDVLVGRGFAAQTIG